MWFQNKSTESEGVRLSMSLCEGETKFVQERMVRVEKSLKDLGIKCESKRVPRIAVLGSGGGERAMIGLLGCLEQMYNTKLLDSVLYLFGVSGSTWCMTSMYEEPAWSSKFPSLKGELVKRLTEEDIDWLELIKWLSQATEDEHYSLTDFWAATVVYGYVKKINTTCLSDLKNLEAINPYPIYTVNDQRLKEKGDKVGCWFELSPHEVGYSCLGAFVDTCTSRSQFEAGVLKQKSAEKDMLYLQGLCGSALADGKENTKQIREIISSRLHKILSLFKEQNAKPAEKKEMDQPKGEEKEKEKEVKKEKGVSLDDIVIEKLERILNLLDCGDDEEITKYLEEIHRIMTAVKPENANKPEKNLEGKSKEEKHGFLAKCVLGVFHRFKDHLSSLADVTKIILKTTSVFRTWTWGTKYNLLYKISLPEAEVPKMVQSDECTYLEDAGLVLNSPYVAALRPDRKVDLLLSFDFSAGDPFLTVNQAAEYCQSTGIPFPPVEIPEEDRKKPKDCYVFKGDNTPTVIHFPLFNMVNTEGNVEKWKETYPTFRDAFDRKTMDELIRVSGFNVTNNKEKIIQEITALCK